MASDMLKESETPESTRMLLLSLGDLRIRLPTSQLPPPLGNCDAFMQVSGCFSGRTAARMAATCRFMYHYIRDHRRGQLLYRQEPKTPGRCDDLSD